MNNAANTKRADELFDLATETHITAMRAAAQIADESKRLAAFLAAYKTWELQCEYQRKVRHGEAK